MLKSNFVEKKKWLLLTMVFVLVFSVSAGPVSALASPNEVDYFDESISEDDEKVLEDALQLVENAPDNLLKENKESELLDWMITNANTDELKSELEEKKIVSDVTSNSPIQPQSVYTCAKGIASSIVQLAVPASKLLKVKKIIKKAGGAKKFATKLIKSYNTYKKKKGYTKTKAMKAAIKKVGKGAGPGAIDALLTFLGVDAFVNGCLK